MLESRVRRDGELWAGGGPPPPYQTVAERRQFLRHDKTRRIDDRQSVLIVGSKADAYCVFPRRQSSRIWSTHRERWCVRWNIDARRVHFLTVSADHGHV